MMYDFEEKGSGDAVIPRASLLDELKQKLYEDVFAREETHIATIDFSDLVSFFLKARDKYENAEQCLVYYEEKKGRIELVQVILDGEDKELRVNNRMCVGRRLVVDELGSSVRKWFNGSAAKVMNKSNIF